MKKKIHTHLSRRETQIMDIIFRLGQASVHEVLSEMDDSPGYNSVRVILGILEEKGYLKHSKDGKRFVYSPRQSSKKAGRDAASHLLKTFYKGSAPQAVATLLDLSMDKLSDDELEEMEQMIHAAKQRRQSDE